MPQKYTTVGGVATLIHHRGPTTLPGTPPDTSRGSTILCLHDAGGNGNQFAALMDALAVDHSPVAYDQPGHGRSGGLDALDSVDAMAGQLHELASGWGVAAPVLVANGSLGAAVALQAAATSPGWAKALVLVGGATDSADIEAEIAQLAAVTSGKARREFDRSGYAPDTDRSVYQRAFADWVKTDPRATLGARRAQAAWSLATPPDVPTLIVVGEHEDAATAEPAKALAGRLPKAATETLAGAGRHGIVEQPEALAAVITAFLAANAGTGKGEG
ncbi:MAG: alpha/beta hydrolase [Acidimicrobiia bacterium]|nr:alpha/beta hydrolase [Acidimicrobiia bacterium]